jgi:hypothetical protein
LSVISVLKRQDRLLYRVAQPRFGILRRQQIEAAFQARDHQRVVAVAWQVVGPPPDRLQELA